mmetsp:Transcript_106361/g.343091  ORF Transcript_106361/g.343091 Transcript_106361/m.343091 type:complete len:778 (-) Transcript_106361:189-2522(-)
MAGEYVEVLGNAAWFHTGSCPQELRGKKFTLKTRDGEDFEVEGEGLCMARKTAKVAMTQDADSEIELPFTRAVVSKLVEYFKFHKDTPPSEIRTPLVSDNLVECGALKWDATFINVDKDLLFEILLAAVAMDIPSLIFLAGAKASLMIKGKSPDKLLKDFKLSNDLPEEEEETLTATFLAQKEAAKATPDESGLGGIAVIINAIIQAAERNNVLASVADDEPGPSTVSLKSYRYASWRAMVLSDWNQLGSAPAEVQADRDLIFAALGLSRGAALYYAAPELREDRKVILEAVKYNPDLLAEASAVLKSDREFVMQAIKVNGAALAGASEELRGDQGLILEAAEMQRGSALKGASAALRSDKAFVIECAKRDPEAVKYAAEELRWDEDFAREVASQAGAALKHMPFTFQANREIVKAAVAGDPSAILFAHTSARADLGTTLPWDSEPALTAERKLQDKAGIGAAALVPAGPRIASLPLTKEAAEAEGLRFQHTKGQKIVQFSALSTMTANMGQSNYIAANCFLDKLPFFERPETDAVTLMWGAVGNIGMRWKAFASADFLNANPEALMQVPDAAKVLNMTATRMDPPEWYAASFFDEWTRQSMLAPTAGMHQHPSEDYQPLSRTTKAPRFSQGKEETGEGKPTAKAAENGPLGGWPSLSEWPDLSLGTARDGKPVTEALQVPELEIMVGTRVELSGLQGKNGRTGTVLKQCSDGKWKVRMDEGRGTALLKACYLVAIAPPAAEGEEAEEAAAKERKLEVRERKAKLGAKLARKEDASA